MADNIGTVATIYEAFGRGDVPAILELLDDDVAWEQGIRSTDLGYLQPGRGKQHVSAFFEQLMATVELTQFEPGAICDGGDVVTVPVVHAGSIREGGEIPPTLEAHVWRFGPDGKVVAFNHVFDVAVHERAKAIRNRRFQGARLQAVGDTIDVKIAGAGFELFVLDGPQHSGPPPHSHPWDEAYIGITGEVEVTIGATVHTLRAGDVMHVPAGVTHRFRIESEVASLYMVTSGHRASAFFADLDANTDHAAPTPETLPGIIAVAKRNGLSSPLFD